MKQTLLLLCLLSLRAVSQSALISEVRYNPKDSSAQYVFPEIRLKDRAAAKKINDTLRSQFLFAVPGCPTDSIFNEIKVTAAQLSGMYDITYETVYNDSYFLSLSISAEACGMYCEPITSRYNFDLYTGNEITLDSLFLPKGIVILTDSLDLRRTAVLNRELQSISERLKTKEAENPDKKDELEEMQTMYSDCAAGHMDATYTSRLEFTFKNGVITLYTGRCSAHYNMVYDELWVMEFPFSLSYWEPYLTTYGKKLAKK